MTTFSFEQFKNFIEGLDYFDIEILKSLYKKYDKVVIDGYFERYIHSLDESNIESFSIKFSAYFELREKEDDYMMQDELCLLEKNNDKKILSDIVYSLVHAASRYSVMNLEEEKKYGSDLNNGRSNLKILEEQYVFLDKKFDDLPGKKTTITSLYPKLNLEKIFLSIKDENDVELLNSVKKLPYSLGDESILRNDIDIIRKYIKLCKTGIPSVVTLKKEFRELNFDNVDILSKEELCEQLNLLKDYVIAQFNFYNRNLRLVISIAKAFSRRCSIEDIIQFGNIGLIKAIDKYDVSKGNKFSTYATWWIKQNITRELAECGSVIRKSVQMNDRMNKYRKFVSDYMLEHQSNPSLEEVAICLNVSVEVASEIINACNEVISLDLPVGVDDSGDTLIMLVSDPSISVEKQVLNNQYIEHVLKIIDEYLTPKEKRILLERVGFNKDGVELTLDQVGKIYGVTRERIRQAENIALKKIRKKLNYSDYYS